MIGLGRMIKLPNATGGHPEKAMLTAKSICCTFSDCTNRPAKRNDQRLLSAGQILLPLNPKPRKSKPVRCRCSRIWIFSALYFGEWDRVNAVAEGFPTPPP